MARQAVAARPGDARSRLWLGLSLWSLGKRPEAEAALRQAVQMGGDDPDAWVALVHFLARTGKPARAEDAIVEAKSKLTGERAPPALAQCWEAVGRPERAESSYQAALSARPSDPVVLRGIASYYLRGQTARAEPHLRKLLDPATERRPSRRTGAAQPGGGAGGPRRLPPLSPGRGPA